MSENEDEWRTAWHRLNVEVDRLRADLADAQRERDAFAAELGHARRLGEITAGRVDAVNDLIDPVAHMAQRPYNDGERYFREVDIRAALSAGGGDPAEGDSGGTG